jgi:phosphatidylglycerophosphate synthase
MASEKLVYKVDDRSILLPFYRRFVVDPFLPMIPARVNPNTITHAGHLINLAGTVLLIAMWPERPEQGWAYIVAMVLLQIYMWCDNADGAHARRTNQCSPLGEFLDHGLDQLNTVYIGYLTAMALGVSPIWWVIIALIIPGAGAVTYWEQSQTGIFRLGLLNQVESLTVLSIALTVSAIFGKEFWSHTKLFGVSLQHAMLGWTATTILFGKARSLYRVGKVRGLRAVIPILGLLGFGGAVVLAAAFDAVSTIIGVTLCTGVNVYFGMRMLAHRLHGEEPRVEAVPVIGTLVLAALVGVRAAGLTVSPLVGVAFAVVACGLFAAHAIGDTRRSVLHLGAMSSR